MRKLLTIGVAMSISLAAVVASADMTSKPQKKAVAQILVNAKKVRYNFGTTFDGKEEICQAFLNDSTQIHGMASMAFPFGEEEDMKSVAGILNKMNTMKDRVLDFCGKNRGDITFLEASVAPGNLKEMSDELIQAIDKLNSK